jgi:DNA-binding transcriptional LysR family regulator
METSDWVLLQTLYEQQNMTKAAEVLFISQPALTYRIQHLEKEFSIKIIHRGRRGIEFTPQGEYLLKYFNDMQLQLQITKEHLLGMEKKISGTLKIGSTSSLARYILPDILKQFHFKYPNVQFKVVTKSSFELINLVYKQDVHIGLIRGNLKWPGEKLLLTTENISIVSSREISLRDLPDLPRVTCKTESSLENIIDNWWKETFPKPANITMEVDKMETCIEMVIHGLGYAILPNIVIRNDENLFRLQLKTKRGEAMVRRSWLIYRKKSLEIPLLKAFVDFVKNSDLLREQFSE